MKTFFSFTLALAALVMMVSCGAKTTSPGAAAKAYVEDLAAGRAEQFVDGIYFDEGLSAEEREEARTMWLSLVEEKGTKSFEEKGGLKSVEVVLEEIDEGGETAVVTLKQTFGNGETEEGETEMELVNGRWMMVMDK